MNTALTIYMIDELRAAVSKREDGGVGMWMENEDAVAGRVALRS